MKVRKWADQKCKGDCQKGGGRLEFKILVTKQFQVIRKSRVAMGELEERWPLLK